MSETGSILLVTADLAHGRSLAEQLRGEGLTVSLVATAAEGFQIARRDRPGIVLADQELPDASGPELCWRVKTDPDLHDLLVAMFSRDAATKEQRLRAFEKGADDFIVRMANRDDVPARVRTLLRLHDTIAALHARGEHYRQLLESLPEPVALIDPKGRFVLANAHAVSLLGYDSPLELMYRNAFLLIQSRDRRRVRASFAATAESGAVHDIECTLRQRSGRLLPVELSVARSNAAPGYGKAILIIARDISERKMAQRQICLLADAVQSAKEMIYISDPTDRIIFANQALLRAFGYKEEEILGETPEVLYGLANGSNFYPGVLKETLGGGWSGEAVFRRKNQGEFAALLSTSLIRSIDGKTLGLVGVARDISDQKRTERQRTAFATVGHRLSSTTTPEEAARIILEVARDLLGWDAAYVHLYVPGEEKINPVLTMDTIDGQVTALPPAALDRSPSEWMRFVCRTGAQLMYGEKDMHTAVPTRVERFGDRDRASACMMYAPIHARGLIVGVLSIQSYTAAAYSKDDLGMLQALADHCGDALRRIQVGEARRQAEAALERSQNLQRAILDNIPEPAWLKNLEGKFLACNQALARFLGRRMDEILGHTASELEPESDLDTAEQDQEVIRSAKPALFTQHRGGAGGRMRWFEIYKSPLFGNGSEVTGTVGIIRDVTEHKRLESELRQLPRRIIEAQETERLRVARELHDSVNQLLAAAQMRLGRLQETAGRVGPATGEILARCHDLLVHAIEENRRIARDLRPSDLDQFGFTIACHNFCREFSARTNLKIKCNIADFGGRLTPDLELNLFRIVQEALHNVAKHSGATTARVNASVGGGQLRLKIQDPGRGFAVRDEKAAGGRKTGVGLTNIRERVAALGGLCEVDSNSGGTTVAVTVPFGPPAATGRKATEGLLPSKSARKTPAELRQGNRGR